MKGCLMAAILAVLATAVTAGAAEKKCFQLSETIEFCAERGRWHRLMREVPETLAVFVRDDKSIGKLIAQKAYTADLDNADVQAAILNLVSKQIARLGGQLDVLALEDGMVNRPAGTILYRYETSGSEVLTVHSYMVRRNMVLQFITAAPGVTDQKTATQTHKAFLSGFLFLDRQEKASLACQDSGVTTMPRQALHIPCTGPFG